LPVHLADESMKKMWEQFLVGGVASIGCITIHALVMTLTVRVARAVGERPTSHPELKLISVMIPTASVLMLAHICEVAVWSLAYFFVDAAAAGTNLVYFAFVNYTTLGYGDITPVENWNLLGPLTAMNGVLLFGWSTAVMFEVLRRVMMTYPKRQSIES
jgi:hypothetical protein